MPIKTKNSNKKLSLPLSRSLKTFVNQRIWDRWRTKSGYVIRKIKSIVSCPFEVRFKNFADKVRFVKYSFGNREKLLNDIFLLKQYINISFHCIDKMKKYKSNYLNE